MMTKVRDLEDLTADGDILELADGRIVRLRIEPDDVNPFEDNPDFYGRIGWDETDYYTGNRRRPSDFDGAAERISIINDMVWWQPPKDVAALRQTDPEAFRKFRSFISELASFGSHYVNLEMCQGEDAYGRPIVVDVAGLGGVDSIDDAYLRDIVSELAAELGLEDI